MQLSQQANHIYHIHSLLNPFPIAVDHLLTSTVIELTLAKVEYFCTFWVAPLMRQTPLWVQEHQLQAVPQPGPQYISHHGWQLSRGCYPLCPSPSSASRTYACTSCPSCTTLGVPSSAPFTYSSTPTCPTANCQCSALSRLRQQSLPSWHSCGLFIENLTLLLQ